MSRWIPWEQVLSSQTLRAESGETVQAVRDRLAGLGGHEKFNALILVRLPDGRIAPTTAPMLRKVAQDMGASILEQLLDELLDKICPEPWAVESTGPEHQAALDAASARRLPVIGRRGEQPLGLAVPDDRTAIQPAYTRDDSLFDLFDDPVPASLLDGAPFVTASLDSTMASVVAELQATSTPERAYVVVARDDGSFGVMRRKLEAEIEQYKTDVWSKPLRAFQGYLQDAESRGIKSLGRKQAESLAKRSLLILVDEQNQVAGLMPPRGKSARGLLVNYGEYDLFDPPLSSLDLSQLDLNRPPFVAAALNTPVIQVADDLQSVPDPQNAYVVVEMEDGAFGSIAIARLNQQLDQFEGEVWDQPLGEVLRSVTAQPSRSYNEVGYRQVRNLVERKKFLILTDDGQPRVLLAKSAGAVRLRASQTKNILKPPQTKLAAHHEASLNMESLAKGVAGAPEAFPLTASGEPPLEPEPKDEQASRVVNTWFAEEDGAAIPVEKALVWKRKYRLQLNIGSPRKESILEEVATAIKEMEPETKEGTDLYASLFSDDFNIPHPTQRLRLPPAGDSRVIEFEVTPKRRTFGPDDKATLDIHIYYRINRVQSWQLQVEVLPEGMKAQSDKPQKPALLFDRTEAYASLQDIEPRHLSIVIDKAPDGAYRFDLFVAGDDKGDKVHLSCRVNLRREDLTHLITKARRQLHNITQEYQAGKADEATQVKAFQALALLGRQLYNRLFRHGPSDSSARQVGKWIQDQKNLPAGSVLQVINRARDFIFPWSLVYDLVPWQDGQMRKDIDREGFWGWRFQIELLTEDLVNSYKENGITIEAPEGLQVGIALNEEIAWGEEQREFFEDDLIPNSGDKAEYVVVDSSPELIEFLEQGKQHVLYVFCHGFTERMATDIQLGDDLLGEFKAWLRTLDPVEREKLKSQEKSLFDVSDSWLKLTYGDVPLTMMEEVATEAEEKAIRAKEAVAATEEEPIRMEEKAAKALGGAPLVFLNMCESAQVLPSLSGGFIPFFIAHGARGIIGTECPMTSTFAHLFAQEFFRRFLRGQPVGQILWDLRREHLEDDNPLGLAYTLYCDANLRLANPVLEVSSQ